MNLQDLRLSCNKIMEIPKEIKYLVNLQELYLSNNKIMKIPIEITIFSEFANVKFEL